MPEREKVRAMFGRIAGRYDLLNRVLSLGIDRGWRRKLIREASPGPGSIVVDACCGTGDLCEAFASTGAKVVGVDFTPEMLALAEKRDVPRTTFVEGDALCLPVSSGSADFASVSFGIRNVADRGRGLRELARVVRPGGRVFVLEFSMPPNTVLSWGYKAYFTRVLPRLGGWISGDAAAYRYLPDTVLEWPSPSKLKEEMERAGLVDCGFQLLTGGVACLSWGRSPGPERP